MCSLARRAGRRSTIRRSSRTRSVRCSSPQSSRRSRPSFERKTERYYRIAGVNRGRPRARARSTTRSSKRSRRRRATWPASSSTSASARSTIARRRTWSSASTSARIITADGDIERTDKWGFREALMRSFRRRKIFPDHVLFMTEDAVRWQPPGDSLEIKGLAFRDLKFEGDPGQPASAERTGPAGARARQLRDQPETRGLLPPGRPQPSVCPRGSSRRRRRWFSRSGSRAAPRRTAGCSSTSSAKSRSRAPSSARASSSTSAGGCTVGHRSRGHGPLFDLQAARQRGPARSPAGGDARTAQALLEKDRPEIPTSAARPAPPARRY